MPSGRGTTAVTNDHGGVAIAAGDAAAVDAEASSLPERRSPEQQCLPSGRGTPAAINDHDDVASATGDAAAIDAAS